MSSEATPLSPSEQADQAANKKIMREIGLAIGGMMIVAILIGVAANSIA